MVLLACDYPCIYQHVRSHNGVLPTAAMARRLSRYMHTEKFIAKTLLHMPVMYFEFVILTFGVNITGSLTSVP